MAGLAEVFNMTGGPDKTSAAIPELEPSAEFLKEFSSAHFTGANGSGPILNANAVLLPTVADNYRDTANTNDFRLGGGLGVSRPYRKQDSMGGQTAEGFHGLAIPNKLFGRDARSHDMSWNRHEQMQRAQMALRKFGYKDGEVPEGAALKPWQWNDIQALGIGTHGNQYNRNYPQPDADAVYRRLYEPTPSRRTQMLGMDVETHAMRPERTMLHPLKVVAEDRSREFDMRIPRGTDVKEAVTYEKGAMPRGWGPVFGQQAVRAWGDVDVLKQPVGTNDTADRSVFDRWNAPFDSNQPLHAATLEDRLMAIKADARYVRGQDVDSEVSRFLEGERRLASQYAPAPFEIIAPGEYEHNASDINGPLRPPPSDVPRLF